MIGDDASWQVVANSQGQLIEGPRWIAAQHCFQWVDILRSTLFRWDPYAGQPAERRELDLDFTTTAEPVDGDRSVIASRNGLHLYDWPSATLTTLGEWDFPADVRFNDSGRSADGTLYVGTMSMAGERGQGSLYRWSEDAGLVSVLEGVGISNGLAWVDSDTAFYIDSMDPAVTTLHRGTEGFERRILHRFADSDEPDGLTITPVGTVLVAMWEGGRLVELSGRGDVVATRELPAASPTSVAFGGADDEFVLVTTADMNSSPSPWDGAALVAPRDAVTGTPTSSTVDLDPSAPREVS